ncbi:GTPase Era [Candidatus Phytoplasma oryzae]|nr:GTPase Era [Candidatus Phytoplasma oryzae]
MFKSGFISIVGKTNVGKSTLLNTLIKQKISITSSKINTTLNPIMGICHGKEYQLIFFDNPGVYFKKNFLDFEYNSSAFKSIQDCDVILFVVDREYKKQDQKILNILKKYNKKIFLVINKTDLLKNNFFVDKIILSYLNNFYFDEIIPLSCLLEKNVNILKDKILLYIKEREPYFSRNIYTNLTQEELIMDLIREKVLFYVNKEIPYCFRILIENVILSKNLNLIEIFSLILVQKESQKKIIIGKKGNKIKKIGIDSRKDISKILNMNVSLNLYVKIDKQKK